MNVLMPQLGETVNEGTVSAWHKKVGDTVAKDELLLDVETDKVATEISAPTAGTLTAIRVEAGETVEVGTVLAVIGDETDGETESEDGTNAGTAADTEAKPEPSGNGKDDHTGTAQRLSPGLRRMIEGHGLEISEIPATGRGGRLTRQDVSDYLKSRTAKGKQTANDDKRIPFDRIRKATAEHMVRSMATSPHVLQAIEVDFSTVAEVRASIGETWKQTHGFSLSYQAFVAKAVCEALVAFPRLNASIEGDALVLHGQINLAIAVDLKLEGLVAPVIRDAASLDVPGLAKAIRELADRALKSNLSADDLRGGTYTLSNPGPFGTLFTAPIINQPQVGILSMDAIQKRAVVVGTAEGEAIEPRPVGVLAQSFDHRAIDGAYSAAFLNELKSLIELKDWAGEFVD